MTDKIERLIFLFGNKCAFPGCESPLIDPSGAVTGKLFVVKDARLGGAQTPDDNLGESEGDFQDVLMLCSSHYEIVNKNPDTKILEYLRKLNDEYKLQKHADSAEVDSVQEKSQKPRSSISAKDRSIIVGGDSNESIFTIGDNNVTQIIKKEGDKKIVTNIYYVPKENAFQKFLSWAYSRFVFYSPLRKFHIKIYLKNLVTEFCSLNLLGRDVPLDLEKIFIGLRLVSHKRIDLLPDANKLAGSSDEALFLSEFQENTIEADAIIQKLSRLVILGDPGSGKTTLLKHLALLSIQSDSRSPANKGGAKSKNEKKFLFPIFVTLNNLARDGQSIFKGMAASLLVRGYQRSEYFLGKSLQQGQCLCLFDGLDEVIDEKFQNKFIDEIDRLAINYPGNIFIITSRIAGFRYQFAGNFTLLEVVEFNDDQIQRFLNNWFSDFNEKASTLAQIIADTPRLHLLASNPLLLSIIALIYELDMKLPNRRVELYDRCVWVLLEEWDRFKKITDQRKFSTDFTLEALEALALRFQEANRTVVDKDQLLAYLRDILPVDENNSDFLNEVMERTGLLRKISRSSYAFIHLTIQEYLSARALHKRADQLVASRYIDNPWWRETIVLLAGIQRNAEKLISDIATKLPTTPEHLLLATRCLLDADETPASLRSEIVEKMVSALKTTDDFRLYQGVEDLASALGENAWKEIISLLKDGNPQIRIRIANLIGAIGAEIGVSPLVNATVNDDEESVRVAATNSLRNIGGKRIIDLFEKSLNVQEFSKIRVIEALGRMQSHSGILVIRNWLKEASEPISIRIDSIEALGRISSDIAIRVFDQEICLILTRCLKDTSSEIRRAASEVLRFAFASVPEGEFQMGLVDQASKGQKKKKSEKKQQMVSIESYHIAKYPITNAQYALFVNSENYPAPNNWDYGQIETERKEGHPVVDITWKDAANYCEWLTKKYGKFIRLQTEEERTIAGYWDQEHSKELIYPWGNEFDSEMCNIGISVKQDTTPVGNFSPQGDSSFGCSDMFGNVLEWTSSTAKSEEFRKNDEYIIQGRAFNEKEGDISSHNGGSAKQDYKTWKLGARIVLPKQKE